MFEIQNGQAWMLKEGTAGFDKGVRFKVKDIKDVTNGKRVILEQVGEKAPTPKPVITPVPKKKARAPKKTTTAEKAPTIPDNAPPYVQYSVRGETAEKSLLGLKEADVLRTAGAEAKLLRNRIRENTAETHALRAANKSKAVTASMRKRDKLADAYNQEFNKVVDRMGSLRTKLLAAKRKITSSSVNRPRDTVLFEGNWSSIDRKKLSVLIDDLGTLTKSQYGGNALFQTGRPIKVIKHRGRAFADLNRMAVHLSDTKSDIMFHEFGHILEEMERTLVKASKSFVEARAKGRKTLRELTGHKGYRLDETAFHDEFISPYVGKVYPDATEVVSMGLEHFIDPTAMARLYIADPEHFRYILGILENL